MQSWDFFLNLEIQVRFFRLLGEKGIDGAFFTLSNKRPVRLIGTRETSDKEIP